ncbi:hypothetical protein VPH35_121985 [Triticum aestivum]
MEDLERRLQLTMEMYVGGARPQVSCVDAAIAISEQLDIPRHHFSVHKFHPEDFLVVFASHEVHNRALGVPFIEHQAFKLFIKPWLRQAQAKSKLMRVQVDLMIEGVPPHAWSRETATELLGSSCLIESLELETANREDLSLCKLRAWCVDPDEVPACRLLWVPEPPEIVVKPGARRPSFRQLLEYPMLIHIRRIYSSNGSIQGEWTMLPWTRGVCDARGARRGTSDFAGSGGHGRLYQQVLEGLVGPSDWRIPPMVPGMTTTTTLGATGLAHGLPRETRVVTAGELVTSTQRDRGTKDMEIRDKLANESRQSAFPPMMELIQPIESRRAALPPILEHSQPMEKLGTDEIMANEDGLARSPPVMERVQQIGMQRTAATQTGWDRDQVAPVVADPARSGACEQALGGERVVPASLPLIPREVEPDQDRCLSAGWAPVEELLAPNDCKRHVAPSALDATMVGPVVGPMGEKTMLHEIDTPRLHVVEVQATLPDQS